MRKAASQLDFLGINYYQSNWIKYHNQDSYIHHNGTGEKGTSVFRVKGIGEVVKMKQFLQMIGIGISILKDYTISCHALKTTIRITKNLRH